MSRFAITLVAGLALAACTPGAGSQSLEPAGTGTFPRTAGKALTIRLADGQSVLLQPGEAKPGVRVTCTLTISEAGRPDQRIVTIGEGDTEALTCGRLKAAGQVPAPAPMQRIALLYEAFGPHATVLQPVILYRSATGQAWQLDDALAQTIGENGTLNSVAAVRRWLGKQ